MRETRLAQKTKYFFGTNLADRNHFSKRFRDIVDCVEQEHEQEVFTQLDDFDDFFEQRKMRISQRTDGQATCLRDKKIKLLRLGYL